MYHDNLQSARLVTRMLSESDLPVWANFFADDEAVQFMPTYGMTSNLERSKHWIDKQLIRYEENRYGLQALFEKDTGNFIGQCGLLMQKVDGVNEIEVGYHIFKKYWGQGFATEAARLFIDYAL